MAAIPTKASLGTPSKPLRNLNWQKIPQNQIDKTIWKSIDESKSESKAFKKLDLVHFEELFSATTKKEVTDTPTLLTPRIKVVNVIDSRRSQNFSIFHRSTLKLSTTELANALEAWSAILTRPILFELAKYIPTEDEIATLTGLEHELENFGTVESFFFAISKVQLYESKINALMFSRVADENLFDVQYHSKLLAAGINDLKTSGSIKEIFSLILAIGNYSNSGNRGGAYGFKLSSLSKVDPSPNFVLRDALLILHIADRYKVYAGWDRGTEAYTAALPCRNDTGAIP